MVVYHCDVLWEKSVEADGFFFFLTDHSKTIPVTKLH